MFELFGLELGHTAVLEKFTYKTFHVQLFGYLVSSLVWCAI